MRNAENNVRYFQKVVGEVGGRAIRNSEFDSRTREFIASKNQRVAH